MIGLKIKILLNFFFFHLQSIKQWFFITENTWKNNGIEVVIVNSIKWLNEKHLENNLGHSNLSTLTLKYADCFKKQRCE